MLILNPDVRVTRGAIELLESFMNGNPETGAAGGYVNDKYLPRDFPTAAAVARENLGFRKNQSYGTRRSRRSAGGGRPRWFAATHTIKSADLTNSFSQRGG